MKTTGRRVSFLTLVLAASCQKTPEPTAAPAAERPSPPAGSQAAPAAAPTPSPAPTALPPVEITWVDPPEWKRSARATPMRKATYTVPRTGSDKEDGELGVFYFGPGQGGGIEANVDRWVKQFVDVPADRVKRADRRANGLLQHTVEIEAGNFNANSMGMGGGKPQIKPDYALLGAIVEAPSGAYFFKLTGPKATVAANKKPFLALLDSIKAG